MRTAILAFFSLSVIATAQDVKLTWMDEPGRLLNAGQQAVLRVSVTDAGGGPLAGVAVTFRVPSVGPSGAFVGDDGNPAGALVKAVSGDDGVASATLQAGSQIGPYLVYVGAPGSAHGTHFGVANVPARTATPALSASTARRTLEAKLPAGGVVYGPVWIPSLATVVAAGPSSVYSPQSRYTTAATGSWLFWIDPNPDRLFGHSVEFVTVDTARTDPALPNARFSRESWWPTVRLSGSATTVQLRPDLPDLFPSPIIPASAEPACAILAADAFTPASIADTNRMAALLARAGVSSRSAWSRSEFLDALQQTASLNCPAVTLHVATHGFAPRYPNTDGGASLGGLAFSAADGSLELLEYTDLAKALAPLQGAGKVQLILQSSYSGSAEGAFNGLGLAGDLLVGAEATAAAATSAEGTLCGAALTRIWQGVLDQGRPFEMATLQLISSYRFLYSPIVADGPKLLPLPNFSLGGAFQSSEASIAIPADFPSGAVVNAKVAIAEPRIAEIDPASASAAAGASLLPLRVFSSGPGVTAYTVELSAGASSSPAYKGRGSVTVGQEVTCTPSRIALQPGYTTELRIAAGSLYDPLYNGSVFNARLLDELRANLAPAQATLSGGVGALQVTGFAPGLTSIEITGTRAWGQKYTACIVELSVTPETGEGTLGFTTLVARTDSSMQNMTAQVRAQSVTVEALARSGDQVCMTGQVSLYGGVGVTPQAPHQANAGKLDSQTSCFWPAGSSAPAAYRFSTLFGGKAIDTPTAIAADAQGNVWIVGVTESPDLPVTDTSRRYLGKKDIFIAKISRFGDRVLYAAYLGGSGDDIALSTAVDAAGDLYLTGYTLSRDFPVTNQAVQSAYKDGAEAFVTKLNGATGALIYSTLYGGYGDDIAYDIAVDARGSAYIVGQTASHGLPVTPGSFQPLEADGPPCLQVGNVRPCPDAFVAKLAPDGASLVYATFLGGTDNDYAYGVAVDAAGNAVVVGATSSQNFPTRNALQPSIAAGLCLGFYNCQDGFITILNPSGTALVASTYLGGSGPDEAVRVSLDGAGNVYVYGRTRSTNLPATVGAFQREHRGGDSDAFLAAYTPTLKSLLGLTYVGSTGDDRLGGLTVTPAGVVYFGISSSEKDLRLFPQSGAAGEVR
jgi:hypothetical protein